VETIRNKLKSFVVISLPQTHHSFTPSMFEGVEAAALFAGFRAGSTFAAVAMVGQALSF